MGKRTAWHFVATGSGRPLILLHGIGLSHAAWSTVTPLLRSTRRVIAFDTAGFGLTPPLPNETPPTIRHLVDGLEQSLREIGVDVPVDMAGNSLGGTMALEAARRGLARSVVAISPACLWRTRGSRHVRYVFAGLRFMARRCPGASKAAVRNPLLRELVLAVPISMGSRRMAACDALRALDDLASSPTFEATFEGTQAPFRGADILVPVTVAFGERDWILPRGSRCRSALAAHTTWVTKADWGHVPLWVDPEGVAKLILSGTR